MRNKQGSKGKMFCLGIDIGSISVNFALVNEDREIIKTSYHRIKGQPIPKTFEVLERDFSGYLSEDSISLSFTGTGGQILSQLLGSHFINEIIAQMKAVIFIHPEAKTIIEIGGEDSKLILLDQQSLSGSSSGTLVLKDFAMNAMCAAGTGSFLDQQATRLGISIEEEFGALALKSQNPARIAGRCSVFAKSDMIHLQQEATPDYDIVAGLCLAMARNFKGSIGKGKTFQKPIVFQGGVAANKGMVRAFETLLQLKPGELIIPKYYNCMGAIGAALVALENPKFIRGSEVLKAIAEYLEQSHRQTSLLPPLRFHGHQASASNECSSECSTEEETPSQACRRQGKDTRLSRQGKDIRLSGPGKDTRLSGPGKDTKLIPAFLGIDVGSISTNVVLIDSQKKVLAKRYLMTAGRPIEAVRKGLDEIGQEIKTRVRICGVGTTGSGRYLIGDFVGADIIKNEITAQARAAAAIDPRVDTIFEIGGQDSKYISLNHGAVVDFEMNKVCAAGTGSFLEEQAEKLDINIKEEFGELALCAAAPVQLGERCTVFMESDLVHHQQSGAAKENLVAGLSYSIVHNYLNRVVAGRKVGNHIFFQGGVAANKGVVAAFEQVVGKPITVPEHHEVTGAIGVALIAQESQNWTQSKFRGFDLSHQHYEIASFECKGCANHCQVKKVTLEQNQPLYYGSRCDRYDEKKGEKSQSSIPDLFAFRTQELHRSFLTSPSGTSSKPLKKVGIPLCLFFHELLPFWRTFFAALGFEVVLSQPTNKEIINQGVQAVIADTCFPIKVSYGHILNLIQQKVDYLFLPSIINMPGEKMAFPNSFNCPYVQTIPYTASAAINMEQTGVKVLSPVLSLRTGEKSIQKSLVQLGRQLGKSAASSLKATALAQTAQNAFYAAIRKKGEEVINSLSDQEKGMVLISRPYNGCDPGLNLEVPKIFREMGFLIIPMDFFPLHHNQIAENWPNMYWRYGQRILSAARFIRDRANCYAVYLTNFSCGPDSFIAQFFQHTMKGKPYLQIEIDEHSAGAGIITRCEAFVDSLHNQPRLHPSPRPQQQHSDSHSPIPHKQGQHQYGQRQLYIPFMSEHAHPLCSAFRAQGIMAQVMPKSDEETIQYGRMYTSGKECFPCLITTGDMIKITHSSHFDPEKSAFFMPSGDGPCRFGQYHQLHRLVLDHVGFPEVPIYSPNQGETFYSELGIMGNEFVRLAWQGIVVVDYLEKWLLQNRPYETHPNRLNQHHETKESNETKRAETKGANETKEGKEAKEIKEVGETEKIFNRCLSILCQAIETQKSVLPAIGPILQTLSQFQRSTSRTDKPVIGIVGEIFVRTNRFSNCDLIREIEALGGEVSMPPVAEWFHYINFTSKARSRVNSNFKHLFLIMIKEFVQKKDEKKIHRLLCSAVRNGKDPSVEQLLDYSRPYLHSSFEGEAILSVGKAIDFARKDMAGLINVMPFTCMPGTIASTILKKVRLDHDDFPFLNLVYDGVEQTSIKTRLEAFLYQARQFKGKS
jgi:predicted CoA-substrate-specific enzyme activase